MTNYILTLIILTNFLISPLQGNNETSLNLSAGTITKDTDIPFKVAERYFVKNNVKNIDNPKIETQEKFDAIFGAAAVMGPNGQPTNIDFTKQYVIAIAPPESNIATTIKAISLQKNSKNEIVLKYKITKGSKQTYSARPVLILIVDKTNNGKVVLKEEK
jgi:hypothetical protein